jgi:formaldehyde-activating enzyme involved in methanogenesis
VRPSSGNSVTVALISTAPNAALATGFAQAAVEQAVHEAERGAVAPPQRQAELVILAVGDVREVHHRRDDPAGDERVVVVERPAPPLA